MQRQCRPSRQSCVATLQKDPPSKARSISFAAVTGRFKLPEALVARLLRHAMTSHIFYEPILGQAAHTLSSVLLLHDAGVHNWLDIAFEQWDLKGFVDCGDGLARESEQRGGERVYNRSITCQWPLAGSELQKSPVSSPSGLTVQ